MNSSHVDSPLNPSVRLVCEHGSDCSLHLDVQFWAQWGHWNSVVVTEASVYGSVSVVVTEASVYGSVTMIPCSNEFFMVIIFKVSRTSNLGSTL